MNTTSMSGGSSSRPAFHPPGVWFWSAALLAAMFACLAVSMVQLASLWAPGWSGGYLIVLSFLTSLEAILSWRGLGRRRFPNADWLVYVGAEILSILLVARLAGYAAHGFQELGNDLALARQDFNAAFLTPEYLFVCGVLLVVWVVSRVMASDLAILQPDERELALEAELHLSEAESRPAARERLASRILWFGSGMTLVVSLLHSDTLAPWFTMPVLRAGVYNLVVYFGLGLVLLSLTQYLTLRVDWMRDRLSIPPGLPARWVFYSLVLLGLLGLVAGLLPTRYSLGMLQTLGYVVNWIAVLLQLLVAILLLPFLLLMAFLQRLFSSQSNLTQPVKPVLPQIALPAAHPPVPWLELLQNLLYWALLVAVLVAALAYYLRERRDLLNGAKGSAFWGYLASFWAWLLGGWRHLRSQAAASLNARYRHARRRWQDRPPVSPAGWLNIRRLSPRQRVQFYYLAMLRRSGEQGYPRRPSQTPYEYSDDLVKISYIFSTDPERGMILDNADPVQAVEPLEDEAEHAGLEQSIRSLTEQFVEARYSAHAISPHQAGLAQRWWELIRRKLRRSPPVG
jgi:hypothetical protein